MSEEHDSHTGQSDLSKVGRLVVSAIATVLGAWMVQNVETITVRQQMYEAQSNHATFEGTWTPHELRLAKARGLLDRFEQQKENHAIAEGHNYRKVGA